MTGEIRIVDPSTGEVIHRIPVDREFDRNSLDDLRKLLGDLSDDLIRKILDLLPTTTTTTTSTSTSSTTTTTTTTLETTTTTTTTTTAPTLPSTTTTTSSTTTTLVPCGAGLVASAEVYTLDNGTVHAIYTPPPPTPSENRSSRHPPTPGGPIILPVGEAGASDGDTWNLLATAGSGRAESRATIQWTIAPCQITASGTFHEKAAGGATDTSAIATIEARHQITLKVKQQVPYTITGSVRASGAASTSSPTVEFLKCESGSTLADANLQSPRVLPITFEKKSSLHPSEELIINCAVVRSSESTAVGVGTDEANLDWSYTITLGQ